MIGRIACALLMTAGLFVILGVKPGDITSVLLKPLSRRRQRKKRIRAITGKKPGLVQRQIDATRQMLESTGMADKYSGYAWLSVVLAAVGLLAGLAMDNILASIVLAFGLVLLPLAAITLRTGEYIRALTEKLETAMGVVTNSYLQSGDFLSAVEDNLRLLPPPLTDIFGRLLVETSLIDANVGKALSHLRDRVDNRYWKDWCGVLIQCQADRQLRYALPGIVERLGETRRVQAEIDTSIRKNFADYAVTVLIVLGSIPLMAFMMPDSYQMLMDSIPGKITVAVVLFAVLASALWVARINRPVDG